MASRSRTRCASGWASALLLLAACATPTAQTSREPADRRWPHERSGLPLDPAVSTAVLPNGVRLAWVDLDDGRDQIDVAFHLAAGSLSEEDDQRGAAHLLEHLVFSDPGARWPPGGAPHVSTVAGWHDTVLRLAVPDDLEGALGAACRGFAEHVLGLAAGGATGAAGVGARDALARELAARPEDDLAEALRSVTAALVAGSPMATRGSLAPEAVPDDDRFAAWCRRWVRPDLVTVVVVGAVADLDVVAEVTAGLGGVPRPAAAILPSDPGAPPSLTAPFVARQVRGLPATQLTVASLHGQEPVRPSRRQLQEQVPLGVARALLRQRLLTAAEGGFPMVTVQPVEGEAGLWGERLTLQCAPASWGQALVLCRRVLEATLADGFDDQPVSALAARARSELEAAAPRTRGDWLAELLAMAAGTAVPMAPEDVLALLAPELEALDGDRCRRALAGAWAAGELSIQSLGPGPVGADAGLALRRAWELGAPTSWAYRSDPSRLGEVASRSHVADLDVHQLVLGNGVRVNLKALSGPGPVFVRAVVGEGQLALPPEDAAVVFAAQQLGGLGGMGLARHDAEELGALASAHGVALSLTAGEDAFQLDALADSGGLVLAMEALAAFLREPGLRDDGLAAGRQELDALYAELDGSARGRVLSSFLTRLFAGDPRFGLPPRDAVAAVGMDEIAAWVAPQLTEGPVELTVVGPFDVDGVARLVAGTFGLLPPRRETVRPYDEHRAVRLVRGLGERYELPEGAERALVQVHLATDDGRDATRRRRLSLLAALLERRLAQELGDLLGPGRGVEVSSSASQVFDGLGDLVIELEPAVGRGVPAKDAVLAALGRIGQQGVTADELARAAEPLLAALAAQQGSAAYWLGVLGRCQREPGRLEEARSLLADYRSVTAADLSRLAAAVLDLSGASWVVVDR